MDMKRLEEIEKADVSYHLNGTKHAEQWAWMIQTIKQQHTLIHDLENMVDHLHNLLADEEGGGG